VSPIDRPGDTFEIIESKPVNQISFYFRRRGNAERFLLVPARCPEQPRFWCFWVYRCDRSDAVDTRKAPWVSPERLRREELLARAQVIHDDIDGWLKGAGRATLRSWMQDGPLGAG
jgi:hypothetical protein